MRLLLILFAVAVLLLASDPALAQCGSVCSTSVSRQAALVQAQPDAAPLVMQSSVARQTAAVPQVDRAPVVMQSASQSVKQSESVSRAPRLMQARSRASSEALTTEAPPDSFSASPSLDEAKLRSAIRDEALRFLSRQQK